MEIVNNVQQRSMRNRACLDDLSKKIDLRDFVRQ